jgi:hypothetical protein
VAKSTFRCDLPPTFRKIARFRQLRETKWSGDFTGWATFGQVGRQSGLRHVKRCVKSGMAYPLTRYIVRLLAKNIEWISGEYCEYA